MIVPTITKKIESQIVEIEGNNSKENIATFVKQMPIADSKYIRKFITECEPSIDLNKEIVAPSGEKVTFTVSFGAEFFRPFFGI